MSIEKLIKEIAQQERVKIIARLATVLTVGDDRTCSVRLLDSGAELSGVNLQSVPGSSTGVFVKPKEESSVVVLLINKQAFIVAHSETDHIELNGSQYGGLIKIEELITQLDKTNEVVNVIVDALTNYAPVPSDGGAALKTYFGLAITGKEIGSFDDIENENVKHG